MSSEAPAKRNWSDLRARIMSAIILGTFCFAMIVTSVSTTAIIVVLGCGAMGWEWRRISGGGHANIRDDVAAVMVACLPAFLSYMFGPTVGWISVVIGIAFVGMLSKVKREFFTRTAPGLFVIAIAGICFVWLRADLSFGLHIALWLPFTVIAADVGAYFAGRIFGGPKLAPKISPNKTVSGAVGGQILAVITGICYGALAGEGNIGTMAVAAFGIAIVSQIGDLIESTAKRSYGVKDASALIPGHGGLLDRFDGLLAAILIMSLVTLMAGSTIFAW